MNNAAAICYIMKDAAFAAADSLAGKEGRSAACRALTEKLLSGWFHMRADSVAVWADGLVTPMKANQKGSGFGLTDLTRGMAAYHGPCFAVSSLAGGDAFERGLYEGCVSIAYLEDGQTAAAVVYDPAHAELFHAVKDMGAYLNGRAISPARTKDMAKAYVSIGSSALRGGSLAIRSLVAEAGDVRVAAACAAELCYTACGRTDATLRMGEAFIDYAAAALVALEAGAVVTDMEGAPFSTLGEYGERRSLAVVCPGLAGELSQYLTEG